MTKPSASWCGPISGDGRRGCVSHALGTKPVTFDGIFVGLHLGGAVVVSGTNQPVSFGGKDGVTIAPGEWVWSDAVALPFAADPEAPSLAGRKLAVSFHIAGESEPMTWHAKALQTSYVTAPGAGARGQDEGEAAFPSAPPLGSSSTRST